jgi:hypothetical protein
VAKNEEPKLRMVDYFTIPFSFIALLISAGAFYIKDIKTIHSLKATASAALEVAGDRDHTSFVVINGYVVNTGNRTEILLSEVPSFWVKKQNPKIEDISNADQKPIVLKPGDATTFKLRDTTLMPAEKAIPLFYGTDSSKIESAYDFYVTFNFLTPKGYPKAIKYKILSEDSIISTRWIDLNQ